MISKNFQCFVWLIGRINYKFNKYFSDPARTSVQLAEKPAVDAELTKLAEVKAASIAARAALVRTLNQLPVPSPDENRNAWAVFHTVLEASRQKLTLAAGTLQTHSGAPLNNLVSALILGKQIDHAAFTASRGEGDCMWPSLSSGSASSFFPGPLKI
jgi:hypothetical protein